MVKKRANGECTFDENGYKRRAACVVYKDEKEDQVLLVSSSHYGPDKNWWIFAGGSIEVNETPRCAAIREVMEESGVKGQILRCIGQVLNDVKRTRTWVYAMIAKDEMEKWDEDRRQRKWFPVDMAKKLLYKPVQATYIELAKKKKGHRCTSQTDSCSNSCGPIFNQPLSPALKGQGRSQSHSLTKPSNDITQTTKLYP